MKRKIITIDEEKCNGCGQCVTSCAEGALRIVNGKARLVREQFCDGFGDCMGECPTGALRIEERESEAYDEAATRAHVADTGGKEAVARMDAAARLHTGHRPPPGGCPGTRMRVPARAAAAEATRPAAGPAGAGHVLASDLEQWPVQTHLVQAGAPFFHNRELVVLSTCAPVACADVHWRFLRGRSVAVGCPKLDDTSGYAEKLGAILADPTIPRVTVVRMEVPCCGGLSSIVRKAVEISGRRDLAADETTIGTNGDVLSTVPL